MFEEVVISHEIKWNPRWMYKDRPDNDLVPLFFTTFKLICAMIFQAGLTFFRSMYGNSDKNVRSIFPTIVHNIFFRFTTDEGTINCYDLIRQRYLGLKANVLGEIQKSMLNFPDTFYGERFLTYPDFFFTIK